MTSYTVYNRETNFHKCFHDREDAIKAMKENNAKCFREKILRNGNVELKQIVLKSK